MSQPKFSRPEALYFPTTFYSFTAKDGNKYCVQDLPESLYEESVDLWEKHFLPEETFSVSKSIAEDEIASEIAKMFFNEALKEKMSIGCFKEDTGELVAVNFMFVKSKDDPKIEIEYPSIKEIIDINDYLDETFDVFKIFNVDCFLSSYALVVAPKFRGIGIATEVLKARVEMLKAYNLTVTSTSFTTVGSQIAAEKAGFNEGYAVSYQDLAKLYPNFDFSKSKSKLFKKYTLKI